MRQTGLLAILTQVALVIALEPLEESPFGNEAPEDLIKEIGKEDDLQPEEDPAYFEDKSEEDDHLDKFQKRSGHRYYARDTRAIALKVLQDLQEQLGASPFLNFNMRTKKDMRLLPSIISNLKYLIFMSQANADEQDPKRQAEDFFEKIYGSEMFQRPSGIDDEAWSIHRKNQLLRKLYFILNQEHTRMRKKLAANSVQKRVYAPAILLHLKNKIKEGQRSRFSG